MNPLATFEARSQTRSAVAGTAHLRFVRSGSQTIVERSFASSPVKLFSTRTSGQSCRVYSATLGGGLVGGDAVRMTLELAKGARALLLTQASTKVYRSLRPASQFISAVIEDDAVLAMVPDPIVCFARADFSQEQRYELTNNANLVAVDWMTSGRHASGERWVFTRYSSRLDVRRGGRRILYDGLLLEEETVSIAERLRGFEVYVTVVVTGPLVSASARDLVHTASQLPVSTRPDMIESASSLADGGAILRIAGVNLEQVAQILRDKLAFLHPLLGDDPWSRKW